MWRTYAGTFTAKRKNTSAAVHSRVHTALSQRRSSSVSSSLEEFIYTEESTRRQQQQLNGEPQAAEEQESTASEGEEQQKANKGSVPAAPRRSPLPAPSSSSFVDPCSFSPTSGSPQPQQPAAPSSALFVRRKQSLLLAPPPEETTADGRLRTPPPPPQRTSLTPPKMVKDDETLPEKTAAVNGIKSTNATSLFDKDARNDRPAPQMPTTNGIEYPRAASWSSSTVAEIMRDPIGRQVFRCFLHEALAEENLLFVEEVEKLKKEKQPEKIRNGVSELLEKYGPYINLSSVAMSKLREAISPDSTLDPKALEVAHKEIYKLLESDQFPRFRRSKLYLGFLEQLLPRSYAERWTTSFDAMLGNQVGRHHFRQFLFSVHAEENLRFWESVIEFRALKNKSTAMLNMGRTIQQQFLREGAHNEVFLPFGLRQRVEKKIKEKDVDETLFDDAVKHVEQILKNDPYVRFLQSKEYNNLLAKLH